MDEYADCFVDHRVVARLGRRELPSLLQRGKCLASIAVVQVAASEVDPMMANAFARRFGWQREPFRSLDGLCPIKHLDGQPYGPDVDVGGAEAEPVVVAVGPDAGGGFLCLGQVCVRQIALARAGCGQAGLQVKVAPDGKGRQVIAADSILDLRPAALQESKGL
ncbi:MAG: hypothetical protein QOH66_2994 [Actinomycetota bacterium]|nr:hypothetical protein [Actinomycetota bacterium]